MELVDVSNTPISRTWSTYQSVNLLKRTSRCLNTEEPCQGNERSTSEAPDPEVIAGDVVEPNRGDHDDYEIREPVGEDTDSCGLVADTKGLDLS